jgi:hypothetical protein
LDAAEGSVHNIPDTLYTVKKENKRPSKIASEFGLAAQTLVQANLSRHPKIIASSKLKKGTVLAVPAYSIAIFRADLWLGFRTDTAVREPCAREYHNSVHIGRQAALSGIHTNTRSRNCKQYQRVGFQLLNSDVVELDLLGVLSANYLQLTRSKTDYVTSDVKYALTEQAIVKATNMYYYRMQTHRTVENGAAPSDKIALGATQVIKVGFKNIHAASHLPPDAPLPPPPVAAHLSAPQPPSGTPADLETSRRPACRRKLTSSDVDPIRSGNADADTHLEVSNAGLLMKWLDCPQMNNWYVPRGGGVEPRVNTD